MMGIISIGRAVIGSDRSSSINLVRPGDRQWVTVIQGVNSSGWALPPFVIRPALQCAVNLLLI